MASFAQHFRLTDHIGIPLHVQVSSELNSWVGWKLPQLPTFPVAKAEAVPTFSNPVHFSRPPARPVASAPVPYYNPNTQIDSSRFILANKHLDVMRDILTGDIMDSIVPAAIQDAPGPAGPQLLTYTLAPPAHPAGVAVEHAV